MLASLLPGLRDLRTPLTVGYLWLCAWWLWFGYETWFSLLDSQSEVRDAFGPEVPVEGLAAIELLVSLLGSAAWIAAVSFVAYLVGTILTVSVERGAILKLIAVLPRPLVSAESRETRLEFDEHLDTVESRFNDRIRDFSPLKRGALSDQFHRAKDAGISGLRPRLLISNPELYGEYDRLAAEATYRANVCLPIAFISYQLVWDALTFLVILLALPVLFYKGLTRGVEMVSTLQGAVVSGIVEHPTESILKRLGESPRAEGQRMRPETPAATASRRDNAGQQATRPDERERPSEDEGHE